MFGVSRAEVLLIGGRSGVGKTTIGWEVAARLCAAGIAHAIVAATGWLGRDSGPQLTDN